MCVDVWKSRSGATGGGAAWGGARATTTNPSTTGRLSFTRWPTRVTRGDSSGPFVAVTRRRTNFLQITPLFYMCREKFFLYSQRAHLRLFSHKPPTGVNILQCVGMFVCWVHYLRPIFFRLDYSFVLLASFIIKRITALGACWKKT